MEPATHSISIQIPTLNSSWSLHQCLKSIDIQGYSNLEIVVIDSGSSDKTEQIATDHGAIFIRSKHSLLGSRIQGIESTSCEAVFLMDSDQILERGTLQKISDSLDRADMLFLEERAWHHRHMTTLQKMYDADRIFVQQVEEKGDPINGVQLPRVFRSSILMQAIRKIPPYLQHEIRYFDHAVLYYEASKLSNSEARIENAIYHIENTSLLSLIKKHYRYGIDAGILYSSPYYSELVRGKSRPRARPNESSQFKYWLISQLLMGMKSIPYEFGFVSKRLFRAK